MPCWAIDAFEFAFLVETALGAWLKDTFEVTGCAFLVLGLVTYIFARFCVLVLAFLTLYNLPAGALDTISWTAYIPHL